MNTIQTELLEISFEEGGEKDSPPVVLLHGWPDAPRGWNAIAAALQADGWRTITPYLRGSGSTRFLSGHTPRIGSGVALARDAMDLADALDLRSFAVVGHDWGARAAYTLAALYPERITSVAALALGYQPRARFTVPAFDQARRFWYQWFMCLDGGVAAIEADPVGFSRIQWDTWSPRGWFDQAEFMKTAEAFSNPDWAAITLNAYRSRWCDGEATDARYDVLQRRLAETEVLSIPTLMVQGGSDFCDAPSQSEGLDPYFSGRYERIVLEGIGHFPHREAPKTVSEAILRHLRR
jgi:pimeloyl-ACP methyl ester carboxylesterase